MIRKLYYFLSVFAGSIILALIVSLSSRNFIAVFLLYAAIFFILGVSFTVFPYVYYNHFSELRVLSKIPKYPPGQIINIMDATATYNVSIKNTNFDIIRGLENEKYIDAKVAFVGHFMEFYQYSHPYVLSYIPFLKISSLNITGIKQGKKSYSVINPELPSLVKCNYFEILTNSGTYRIIVLQISTDRFIDAIQNSRKS